MPRLSHPAFRTGLAAAVALTFATALSPARAEPIYVGSGYADPVIEPNAPQACAPHAQDFTVPGLWLGHFTGGRFVQVAGGPAALDWRDQYSCFPTRISCERWQRSNLRAYHKMQGYRTCMPLRGGGRPIRPVEAVVIAKY
jgi:hypothetical protein